MFLIKKISEQLKINLVSGGLDGNSSCWITSLKFISSNFCSSLSDAFKQNYGKKSKYGVTTDVFGDL